MRFRTTGVLLVIFVVLAGYVFFFERNKKPAETPTDKSTWILTLAQEDVQQLAVTDQGTTAIVARGGDNLWYVGGVGGQEADATRVDTLIASLVDLKSARTLTQTTESLAAFGLEPPAITVTVGLSGTQQEVLFVGDKNPQGSQYYMQHKGQTPIYLVYSAVVDDLKGLVSNPPYKPTATPAPEATPSAAATPKP